MYTTLISYDSAGCCSTVCTAVQGTLFPASSSHHRSVINGSWYTSSRESLLTVAVKMCDLPQSSDSTVELLMYLEITHLSHPGSMPRGRGTQLLHINRHFLIIKPVKIITYTQSSTSGFTVRVQGRNTIMSRIQTHTDVTLSTCNRPCI